MYRICSLAGTPILGTSSHVIYHDHRLVKETLRCLRLPQDPKDQTQIRADFLRTSNLPKKVNMAPINSSDKLGISVLVLIILFTVLASVTVWGRFWSRYTKKISPAANDYVILVALVRLQSLSSGISALAYRCLQPDLHVGCRHFKCCGLHFGCIWSACAICV